MFSSPGDTAFTLFGLPVYNYGIVLAFSVLVGVYCAYFLYKKFYDKDKAECIIDFAPYLIILGLVGARLYYCFLNFGYYFAHPVEIFYFREGGLSVHGMIITGFLALFFLSRLYKMSFAKVCDVCFCGAALAQSIGRWGNFFNSEAFGVPCDLPWKLYIPPIKRPLEFAGYEYFHPTFLYESILDFLIFILLLCLFKKLSKTPGIVTCLYIFLYSLARIAVESIRIDSALNIYNFPIAQIVSVFLALSALVSAFCLLSGKRS